MRGRAARCRRERGRRSQQREPAKIGEPPGELNPQQHRGLLCGRALHSIFVAVN